MLAACGFAVARSAFPGAEPPDPTYDGCCLRAYDGCCLRVPGALRRFDGRQASVPFAAALTVTIS